MKAVRTLRLRREELATLGTDEVRLVGGQGTIQQLTPVCPVILTVSPRNCLSIFVCTVTEGEAR